MEACTVSIIKKPHGLAFVQPTNREKRMKPKRGLGVCHCDRTQLRVGQKCPVCRRLMKRRTLKKDTNA